jgi:uncharacterized protein (TIGR03083 family)
MAVDGEDWPAAPIDVGYERVRHNVTELLMARPDSWGLRVAACPEWLVGDMLAHLVNNCRSALARVRGETPPEPLPDKKSDVLLAEWARAGAEYEAIVRDDPEKGNPIFLMDAFTHELDLRVVLGEPAPADHPAHRGSIDVLVAGLSWSVGQQQLPTLRIETDGAHWATGSGEPAAVLHGPRYDLYRSLGGRRTHAQITGLAWSTDPSQWLPAFSWGPFAVPAEPVEAATSSN